jgi:DNA-binding NtrC family response regulator
MRLQCRDLTEKNWDMLLNNAASPIHATGYTVYLENVDTLPKDLQQQVGIYIEDTKMTHRHRVISSSCCDLSAEVARGQFSSRLYLQLSGFTINVPSLAQRKEDIPAFVNMMIPQYNTALANPPWAWSRMPWS